jgi:hypothetical protein
MLTEFTKEKRDTAKSSRNIRLSGAPKRKNFFRSISFRINVKTNTPTRLLTNAEEKLAAKGMSIIAM